MGKVQVVEKTGEIEGKPIKWNVLSIQGFMSGELHTLELKLMKTEATLARMLLGSNESGGEVKTKEGGEVDVTKKEASWLD